MDGQLKYVKTSEGEIIIFPITIQHKEFAKFKPVAAGFCFVGRNKVSCFGESFSLQLKADEKEDTITATRQVFGVEAAIELMENEKSKKQTT